MKKNTLSLTICLACLMSGCGPKEEEGADLDQMVFAEDEEKTEWHAADEANQEIVITEPEPEKEKR